MRTKIIYIILVAISSLTACSGFWKRIPKTWLTWKPLMTWMNY